MQKVPSINEKTPDLLVRAQDGVNCIVECTTAHWQARDKPTGDEHGREWTLVDDSNPPTRSSKSRQNIGSKLCDYAGKFPGQAFVVAIYNQTALSWDYNAVEVCFGRYNLVIPLSDDENKKARLERAFDPRGELGFFENSANQHCSAIIHSTNLFQLACVNGEIRHVNNPDSHHLLIPNPNATHKVPEKLFPFCEVLDLPKLFNADFSVPMRKPLA